MTETTIQAFATERAEHPGRRRAPAAVDETSLAMQFLTAADVLADEWRASRVQALPVPALELYRRALELALKEVVGGAARCLRAQGFKGFDANAEFLAARLATITATGALAEMAAAYLARVPLGESRPSGEAFELVRLLGGVLDGGAVASELAVVQQPGGRRLVVVDARSADFDAVAAALSDAIRFVARDAAGALEQFADGFSVR